MNKALTTNAGAQHGAQSIQIASGITVVISHDAKWSRSTGAALVLLAAAHPKTDLDDMTLSAYDVILRNYPPELAAAAAQETLARCKWFPKPQEIAESARNLLTLIHSRGMYATDEAGRKRRDAIRTWELDMLEDTRDFIALAKNDKRLRAELASFARMREAHS